MPKFSTPLLFAFALILLLLASGCVWPRMHTGPSCGNLECEAGEDSTTCPQDCGVCTDTDGVNYFTAGTTIDGTGASISDSCTNGVLTEGLCYQNLAYSFKRQCDAGCNAAGTVCEGTGSEVPAGQYCFAPNPENPADPNLNYYLELSERTCHPTEGVEEVWTCATTETGANFSMVEDCALRSPAEACIGGACQPVAGACQHACCSDADCSAPYGTCSNPGTASAECVCQHACCSNSECVPPYDICSNAGTPSAQCIPDPSLVLQYNFDSDVTPVQDLSGNNNAGTVNGATFGATAGINSGGAYMFSDANTDYISIANSTSLNIPSSWTVSAWVKLNALPASGKVFTLVAKGNSIAAAGNYHNYVMAVENGVWGTGSAFGVTLKNTTGTRYTARWATTLTTGTWYHVAGVYDDTANELKIYVNGALKASTAANITAATNNACVTTGRYNCDGNFPADSALGAIDEVKIYKRALAADEISKLYNQGNCATPIPCFSNSDCGTNEACQNAGVCGSAACAPCTVACSSDAQCATGGACLKAGTCDASCAMQDPSEVFFYDFTSQFSGATPVLPVDDITPNDNNGTPSSGTARISNGRFGYGADFNGISGYIAPPATTALTDAFTEKTISMWIKANTMAPAKQVLYDEGTSTTGVALWLANNNTVQFSVKNTGTLMTKYFAFSDTANWHHLAAVFNGGGVQLYMDGVLRVAGTATFTSVGAHAVAPAIGRTDGTDASGGAATGNYFYGRMDEVRVFNRALSATEINGLLSNCIIACDIDRACDDADALTLDICSNPSTCAASCSNTQCAPACGSSVDCPAGQNCFKPNTCEASCAVSDPSLMLFYTFATSAIPVADISGHSNTGTLPTGNARYRATGGLNSGGAYDFNYTGSINVGDKATLDIDKNDFAISVWFKGPADATANIPLVSKRPIGGNGAVNGYITEILAAGDVPYIQIDNSNGNYRAVTGTTDVSDGAWHNLVFVADRDGNGYIYVDGVLNKTDTIRAAGGSLSNTQAFDIRVGCLASCGIYGAASETVTLDNVMVYNRTLSEAEVGGLFNEGSCTAACRSATDCDDANILTIDTCNLPDSCAANCSYCGIECYSDSDCPGGNYCAYDGICGKAACVAFDSNLMLWYPFSANDTPVYDMSEQGSNGTKSGDAAWLANGKSEGDGAYSFGGVNGYIQTPTNSKLWPAEVTVAAWVNITGDGAATPNVIVSARYYELGYELRYDETTDKFQAMIGSRDSGSYTVSSNTAPAFGTWYNVAFTYTLADVNRLKIYVNGVLDGNAPASYPLAYQPTALRVGEYAYATGYALNGKVDDVRVYNRALSASEILTLVTGCPTPITCYADADCGALSKCQSPGVCGSATCVPCTSACSTDAECGAGKVCVNKNTCNSYCENTYPGNVLYYDFETSAAAIPDLSGNGNNGTVAGATYQPQSRLGRGAYFFDGANDYVSAPYSPSLNLPSAFTIAAWVWPDDTSTNAAYGDSIINQFVGSSGYDLTWSYSAASGKGSFRMGMGNGTTVNYVTGSDDLPNNGWYFVVVTGGLNIWAKMYVNGNGTGYRDNMSCAPAASRPLMVGGECPDPANCVLSRQFKGKIDEVRVYNRVLTSAEVQNLYNQGTCETGIACFSNSDCGTNETCQNAGVCGAASCVTSTVVCTSNVQCPANSTCMVANTSSSFCSRCSANADCDDGIPATIDVCSKPSAASSSCVNITCGTPPACISDSDCVDADSNTMNICSGAGSCSASCTFPSEYYLTGGFGASLDSPPAIASNGNGYGVFWFESSGDGGQLNYKWLNAAGRNIASNYGVTPLGMTFSHYKPSVVWNNERQEYAVVVFNGNGIYFTRVGMDGIRKGDVTLVTAVPEGDSYPVIALNPGSPTNPNDDRYGIAWGLNFAETDALGSPIPSSYRLISTAGTAAAVWTGSVYKVFSHAGGVTTIDPGLGGVSSAIIEDDGYGKADLTAEGNGGGSYAALWRNGSASGTEVHAKTSGSDPVLISSTPGGAFDAKQTLTSVTWNGSEYSLAWADERNFALKPDCISGGIINCNDIYFARFSQAGAKIGSDIKINNCVTCSTMSPAIACEASSGRCAVAWIADNILLYFKLVPQ